MAVQARAASNAAIVGPLSLIFRSEGSLAVGIVGSLLKPEAAIKRHPVLGPTRYEAKSVGRPAALGRRQVI
jgi:hypothetical protein